MLLGTRRTDGLVKTTVTIPRIEMNVKKTTRKEEANGWEKKKRKRSDSRSSGVKTKLTRLVSTQLEASTQRRDSRLISDKIKFEGNLVKVEFR